MKKFFAFSVFMVGCVNQSVPVATPDSTVKDSNCEEAVNVEPDNVEKAKQLISGGAQLVYNKSKNVYEWVVSEDNRDKVIEFANTVKDKANDAVEQAKSKAQELIN